MPCACSAGETTRAASTGNRRRARARSSSPSGALERSRRLSIVFDNAVGELKDPAGQSRFERLVSEAATVAVDHLARGFEVELVTRDQTLGFSSGARQRLAVLEALALIQPRARGGEPLGLERSAGCPSSGSTWTPTPWRGSRDELRAAKAPAPRLAGLAGAGPAAVQRGSHVAGRRPLSRRGRLLPPAVERRLPQVAAGLGDERPGARLPAALLPRPRGLAGAACGRSSTCASSPCW